MTSVQQIEQMVRIARELGRDVATGRRRATIYKIGVQYDSDRRDARQARHGAEPRAWPARLPGPGRGVIRR